MELTIIKRDGQKVPFDIDRITNAVFAAAKSVGGDNVKKSHRIAYRVLDILEEEATAKSINEFEVEHIQDLVEQELIESGHAKTAKAYILYRQKRSDVRSLKSVENKTITDLVFKDASEIEDKRENANIDGNSVMGTMLKVGSTVMKEYVIKNVMKPKHADMYRRGIIHYHDMDFSLICINCNQILLSKLLDRGFVTGHGSIRSPSTIGSASTLACIAVQSNQNDMFQHHGTFM